MPYDKKLHFGAGVIISCLFGCIFSPLVGLQLSILAGLCKEIYDWQDYGCFDIFDMIATWAGGAVGFIILCILK